MSMVAKILIVLNLVLAVAVMGAAGAYLNSAENWKRQYNESKASMEKEIAELRDRNAKTQSSLDEANRTRAAAITAKDTAEVAAKQAADQNSVLQKKLDDLIQANQSGTVTLTNLETGLKQAREQNDKLLAEKAAADAARRTAMQAKDAAETEQKRLQNELDNATAMNEAAAKDKVALAERNEALNTENSMYRSKFGPIGMPSTPVKGMVLAADSKQDIYLISVGSKDQVKVGDELTVYRGDQFVAVVVVDKVFDDKASVITKREGGKALKKDGMDIRQGDKVATVY
ncbi:MAG TPA: hypothetical protein VFS92_00060 [Planctomycetota bacterium]|nr:hypothetical protein [Planctomycetota bacterium]